MSYSVAACTSMLVVATTWTYLFPLGTLQLVPRGPQWACGHFLTLFLQPQWLLARPSTAGYRYDKCTFYSGLRAKPHL